MNYPLYIAKRYLFSKSHKSAVNSIARIAIVAVIIGAMSLFIVLSGFSGLKDFALQFTDVFDSDLKALPEEGKTISLNKSTFVALQKIQGIAAVSKIIEERVFIQYKGKNHIAYLKGVDKNYKKVAPMDSLLFVGNWFAEDMDEVVMGFGISSKLSLPVNDFTNLIELYVPKPGTNQITLLDPSAAFSSLKVVASGIFDINEELNNTYLFGDVNMARELLQLDSLKVSGLEFKLEPTANEQQVINDLKAIIPQKIDVKNRIQQNDALYKMLNAENLFTYLFVSLIAAIAIFNITGTIIMVILEKRANLKTLYSLGLTLKDIRKVFFFNGLLMTLLGTLVGLLLGSVIVLLQFEYGFVPITPTLPYPVKFKIINLLIVLCTILFLGGIASKVASLRVTKELLS